MATDAAKPEPPTLAEVARELVEQTRAAQGLPFHVEDPATLHRVALLMSQPTDPRDG